MVAEGAVNTLASVDKRTDDPLTVKAAANLCRNFPANLNAETGE